MPTTDEVIAQYEHSQARHSTIIDAYDISIDAIRQLGTLERRIKEEETDQHALELIHRGGRAIPIFVNGVQMRSYRVTWTAHRVLLYDIAKVVDGNLVMINGDSFAWPAKLHYVDVGYNIMEVIALQAKFPSIPTV